jgi:AraC-like DNA-binding protein
MDWKDAVFLAPECRERFVTEQTAPTLSKYGIFMAGLAELWQAYIVERKGPEHHTLLFTLGGTGQLTTPFGRHEIHYNTMTILPASLPFRFELAANASHWQIAWLLLNPGEYWPELEKNKQQVIHTDVAEPIWSLLALIYNRYGNIDSPWLSQLVTSIRTALVGKAHTALTSAQQRVQTVFQQIAESLHQPWTTEQIAKLCCVSEVQLNRLCHLLFLRTPHQQLTHLRMNRAIELLRHSTWSISIIATHTGYADAFSFSKRFRKHWGVSPRDYRNKGPEL